MFWQLLSFYEYEIDLAPNAAFLAIFSVSLLGFFGVWIATRRGTAFNVAMILGLICEILGYVGRILSWQNPTYENGFLMQICCLTIGPAFMAAGLYLCLRRIVSAFGPENSRISPEYYTRIFIPCDLISLILQAVGGGMASTAARMGQSAATGTDIMIAGLVFQVITIIGFIACSIDFAIRTMRRKCELGDAAFDQRLEVSKVRNSPRFKAFLGALSLSTFCILWRSVFRVAELSRGWRGPIMANQYMFVGFEGILIVVAVAVLNVFHPALCMKELLELNDGGLKGLWGFRSRASMANESENSAEYDGKTPTTEAIAV
ncbi:hypothetical protein KAF25_008482 [Fusarium avenaceum]|uniref:Sphingoid long-chain base transporter RSB1 n=1 Tax=Fusarium avenaceum TaxID=40199 RepID=A0A9P7HAK5_9HYPO|nr:hypothetical protein KAF25_008482 [Fusarium avenaceum]